jgi:hypothetical protein
MKILIIAILRLKMYIQALTLNEHPRVSFALPPVGLHRIVLQLFLFDLPFTLNDSLGMTKDSGQSCAAWAFNIHKE